MYAYPDKAIIYVHNLKVFGKLVMRVQGAAVRHRQTVRTGGPAGAADRHVEVSARAVSTVSTTACYYLPPLYSRDMDQHIYHYSYCQGRGRSP